MPLDNTQPLGHHVWPAWNSHVLPHICLHQTSHKPNCPEWNFEAWSHQEEEKAEYPQLDHDLLDMDCSVHHKHCLHCSHDGFLWKRQVFTIIICHFHSVFEFQCFAVVLCCSRRRWLQVGCNGKRLFENDENFYSLSWVNFNKNLAIFILVVHTGSCLHCFLFFCIH